MSDDEKKLREAQAEVAKCELLKAVQEMPTDAAGNTLVYGGAKELYYPENVSFEIVQLFKEKIPTSPLRFAIIQVHTDAVPFNWDVSIMPEAAGSPNGAYAIHSDWLIECVEKVRKLIPRVEFVH
ncbi:hypothetical protein [Xanthobacter sp. YC-JY1]|uniref:hypothetical protein n=1 Tax=Xanthobacter sp. YC-JY1 TaxID=2419844 RepID=UPI001F32F7EF|nr:hypothetical protein [Xanthobacter sp. YC-JY1]UJX46627.1 hypothetical protein D7006_19250 [Xanthobacter sp. YC-JY1]